MDLNTRAELHAKFVRAFCPDAPSAAAKSGASDLVFLEADLNTRLPRAYSQFLVRYGAVYCPRILRLIMAMGMEFPDLRMFHSAGEIGRRTRELWRQGMSRDLIAFAQDCMGNAFCFRRSDAVQEDVPVLFFSRVDTEEKDLGEEFDGLLAWYLSHAAQMV